MKKELDEWLNLFKKTHDLMQKIVLSEYGKKQKLSMHIKFHESSSGYINWQTVEVYLQKGTETIDDNFYFVTSNSEVYKYILINTFTYILKKDFSNWKSFILLNDLTETLNPYPLEEVPPIIIDVASLNKDNSANWELLEQMITSYHYEKLGIKENKEEIIYDLDNIKEDYLPIYLNKARQDYEELSSFYEEIQDLPFIKKYQK